MKQTTGTRRPHAWPRRTWRWGFPLALLAAGAGLWGAGTPLPGCPPVVELRVPRGARACAKSINNRGQVVGYWIRRDWEEHACLWENGRRRDLGSIGGTASGACAINNLGQAVGYARFGRERTRPVLWEGGRAVGLRLLPGCDSGDARAINDRGQIVGYYSGASHHYGAVLWESGSPSDLSSRVRLPAGCDFTSAEAINNRGQLTGILHVPGRWDCNAAYLWDGRRLRIIPPSGQTVGIAINEHGDVLGQAPFALWDGGRKVEPFSGGWENTPDRPGVCGSGGGVCATLYEPGPRVLALFARRGWKVVEPYWPLRLSSGSATVAAANERGQMVVYVTIHGTPRAFLVPVRQAR